MSTPAKIMKMTRDRKVAFVDFRFTDTIGKFHHITVPAAQVSAEFLAEGKNFDGSSIEGWRDISDSDMVLRPDLSTATMDPFMDEPTLALICTAEIPDKGPYNRCPRSIAAKVTAHLKKTGVGDSAMFGPEPEFFVFDSVVSQTDPHRMMFEIHCEEGSWSASDPMRDSGMGGGAPTNLGHRPLVKGGYFPLPPVDSLHDLRGEICKRLEALGVPSEVHHHEVGGAGQCEVGAQGGAPVRCGDNTQILKYVVRQTAHEFGKTATFMPKPLFNDNGSGMHVHQSISRNGRSVFAGKLYAGLSQEALWYIGGIIRHARALNAITNPATNSYKRLLPGFEAPVKLAYAARNRSASIRIPHSGAKSRRVETRFPDPMANPYLCFSALLLAGLDGIKNKIDPGKPSDFNLYHNRRSSARDDVKHRADEVCGTLREALEELSRDRKFLTASGVFDDDVIDAYIELKNKEVDAFRTAPHPVEFQMYYSN